MAQKTVQQETLNGVRATNDNCGSALGGATYQLRKFGGIGICHLDKIDITGAPGDVSGESARGSTRYQKY